MNTDSKKQSFMTSQEAEEWNAAQPKAPLSKNHWSVKGAKIDHALRMGLSWKRLAKALRMQIMDMVVERDQLRELVLKERRYISNMHRVQCMCNRCGAPTGVDCSLHCSRDGNRDQ